MSIMISICARYDDGMVHTVQLCTGVYDTRTRISSLMGEHGMAYTIFLTQASLEGLPFHHIINLHAIVALRGKKVFSPIAEIQGDDGRF